MIHLPTYYRTALFVLLIAMGACSILSQNSHPNDRVSINNDTEQLKSRIQIVNDPVQLTGNVAKSKGWQSECEDDFIHVANVKSPVDQDNNTLSATSVDISAHTVYVSYHLYGNKYAGAIDIIDLKNQSNPQIVSTISFNDTDVNALEIDPNRKKLWIAGGRDVERSGYDEEGHHGAIVGEFEIDKGTFEFEKYREAPLPSYSGNALVEMNNELYLASGASGGGYFELDQSTLSLQHSVDNEFAKYVERRKSDIIGLSLDASQSAKFEILDFKKDEMDRYDINQTVAPPDGKNVIEQFGDITFAALGDQGVMGFKFDGRDDPLVYEYNVSGNDVANGVTIDGKYVYIANGTDGLYITTHPNSDKKSPDAVFNWNSGVGSANFVKTDGNYIIVANGTDGLNILRKVPKNTP